MERIVTGTGMKKTDSYTIEKIGIPSMVLMERAAFSMFQFLKKRIKPGERVLCLCGMGNNGADGIALARQLVIDGTSADIMTIGSEKKATIQWKEQKNIALNCGVTIRTFEREISGTIDDEITYNRVWADIVNNYDYVVDALFGIGLKRDVEGLYKRAIDGINYVKDSRSNHKMLTVISVDVPSGLCADTGQIMGTAIKADYTLTFGAKKSGLILYEGKDMSGEIVVCDIGIPKKSYDDGAGREECFVAYDNSDIKQAVIRKSHSNKGTYGKVLVIAGSETIYGAAFFSSMAALKTGCGLVRIITHKNNRDILYNMIPEAIINVYDENVDEDTVEEAIKWSDSVVIGPGLGTSENAKKLLCITMNYSKQSGRALVIDADGLNIISSNEELKDLYHGNVVITPHIGEASRLMGKSAKELAENIVEYGKMYSKENHITVVMKDSATVILGIESLDNKCNNRVCVNTCGNAGMATGGSGDVLSGIIAGVIAGGIGTSHLVKEYDCDKMDCNDIFVESSLAVRIHGMAGDLAAEKNGATSLTATDILNMIPNVLK